MKTKTLTCADAVSEFLSSGIRNYRQTRESALVTGGQRQQVMTIAQRQFQGITLQGSSGFFTSWSGILKGICF